MRFFNEIKNIFYPNICLNCETVLSINEKQLCTLCLFNLPLTNYLKNNDKSVEKIFYGRVKIERATAFLFYNKKGITQTLIHKLKYKGYEEIGGFFGDWFGEILKDNNSFNNIDYIIPVPLHKKRQKVRGYNQLTKFGERLSINMNKPFLENILIKKASSKTQTKKSRLERIKNVNKLFFLTDLEIFQNKHILLIDDIITTGATIEACANELFLTKNIKISIISMAISE